MTLNSVFEEHKVSNIIDLLTIDVEGHELQVLDSIDLNIYSVRMIVVEMHDFNIDEPHESAVYRKLNNNGYQMKFYLSPTGFFIKDLSCA